jgi:NAD-dependent SIR2 family protein deacetylase
MLSLEDPNIKTLQVLSKKEDGIAAFAGAGCSKALLIPLWRQMLIDLNKEFRHYSTDAEVSEDIKASGYPKVASKIRSKASDDNSYKDALRKFTKPQACHFTSLHIELVLLSKMILTTNYDHSFEEALQAIGKFGPTTVDCKYEASTLGKFNQLRWGVVRQIFHLHGDIVTADVVLTAESYEQEYENPYSGVATLVNSIFSSFPTLFVGFSFDDDFFVGFLKKSLEGSGKDKARHQESLPNHYCIMSDNLKKDFMTAKELLSVNADINELLTMGFIEQRTGTGSSESIFHFTSQAPSLLNQNIIPSLVKQYLIDQMNIYDENRGKMKLMSELGIELIYFEGKNYLQIELILRKINEKPVAYSSSYRPN